MSRSRRPCWPCPICLQPVIPGGPDSIQNHRDSIWRDRCPGSGLPFHTTGALVGVTP